eukprot:scaffold872_cov421-Prasinococcus_capsulatus_cf.AAC.1
MDGGCAWPRAWVVRAGERRTGCARCPRRRDHALGALEGGAPRRRAPLASVRCQGWLARAPAPSDRPGGTCPAGAAGSGYTLRERAAPPLQNQPSSVLSRVQHVRTPATMLMREIAIASGLAVACGLGWKTYHWNYMRKLDSWYAKYNKGEISALANRGKLTQRRSFGALAGPVLLEYDDCVARAPCARGPAVLLGNELTKSVLWLALRPKVPPMTQCVPVTGVLLGRDKSTWTTPAMRVLV